jgi:hypothetical protein
MKNWALLILLMGFITVILIACDPPDERPTPAPLISPVADSPIRTADPTTTISNPPATTILPKTTVTTEPPDPASLPTVTLYLPATTTLSEPGRSDTLPTTDDNPTAPLPPAPTAASAGNPLINFFKANVEETDPGRSITLEWSTTNAMTVTLWHLAPTGQFSNFWAVSESGSFDYPVAMGERNRSTFALSAADGQGNSEMATVAVVLRCPDEWFFADSPDICPATAANYSAGAEQQFERGTMIWIRSEERIYVLFGDGQQIAWTTYTDDWIQGAPENDPDLAPPSGMYQPVRGFGLVWREQPGVKDRLGWAITEEGAYDTAVQRTSFAKYNETYIRALDGKLWRLLAERSDWVKINPGVNS